MSIISCLFQFQWAFAWYQKYFMKQEKDSSINLITPFTEIKRDKKTLFPFPYKEISFHSSGWMQIFQFGVAKYIQTHYSTKDCIFTGTSGGALVACTLCCDIDPELIKEIITKGRKSHWNVFRNCLFANETIDTILPKTCLEQVQNRLVVACSKVNGFGLDTKHFQNFKSYEDVANTLKAAVHIPLLDGCFPVQVDSEWIYDGMFTDTHPQTRNSCLKVTWDMNCQCGCTKKQTNNTIVADVVIPFDWCIFPPNDTILLALYEHGYYQAKKFFAKNKTMEWTTEDILNADSHKKRIEKHLKDKWDHYYISKNTAYISRGIFLFLFCVGLANQMETIFQK